jgi:cephalosporin hydroxylase
MSNVTVKQFQLQRQANVKAQGENKPFFELTQQWVNQSCKDDYCYSFDWMSRPIIQYPQDMVALQEIIWQVKPDLIIECGIAHGGSLIYSASLLAMHDYCEASGTSDKILDLSQNGSKVLGIDVDIRPHNLKAIKNHPLSHKIQLIEGSSITPETIARVKEIAKDYETILVLLDSNHTHEHVLGELNAYAMLATIDSYCIVYDTVIEDMPSDFHENKPWAPGNSPKTAVWAFVENNKNFEIDHSIVSKLMITVAPDGYLKRIG